jgi:hypothetical protein
MKFRCGMPRTEKRRIKRRIEKDYLSNWHCKFAWLPIRVGVHDCRWLENIERKGTWYNSMLGGFWMWEYRAYQYIIYDEG